MSNESPTVKIDLEKERLDAYDQLDRLDSRRLPPHWEMRLALTDMLLARFSNAKADEIAELVCAIAGKPHVRTFRNEIYTHRAYDPESIP